MITTPRSLVWECIRYKILTKLTFQVIPPKEWKGLRTPTLEQLSKVSVYTPIEQNIQGNLGKLRFIMGDILGLYHLLLIPKKSMKLPDFRKKYEASDRMTKDKSIDEVENLVSRHKPL